MNGARQGSPDAHPSTPRGKPGLLAALRKRDPAIAAIATAWRRLTTVPRAGGSGRIGSGAKTVVACSGGADSSALVLALACSGADLVVAHVVHDQRPEEESLADCDAVRELARSLGLPFEQGEARSQGCPGNAEATLRRGRYAALTAIAKRHGARFIATAHHADDQVETVLMALLRGAGTRGLRGIAPRQKLASSAVRLIRPMLGVEPAEARRLCTLAGWAWREDRTNTDTSRLRSRLRHEVLPKLLAARPAARARIGEAAAAMRDADRALREAAKVAWKAREIRRDAQGRPIELAWERRVIVALPRAVAGVVLLRAARQLGGRADRVSRRQVVAALRAFAGGERVTVQWAHVGLESLGQTIVVRRRGS